MSIEPHIVKALEQIFRENRRTLERLAYYFIGDEEEARDIVSQCFISMWEHMDSIKIEGVRQYLFITMRNLCLDYRRKSTIHKKIFERILQTEKSAMESYTNTIESRDPSALLTDEIRFIFQKTILSMPTEVRESFIKTRFEGLSYKDAAAQLGITPKKVDKNIQNVTKRLRIELAPYLNEKK